MIPLMIGAAAAGGVGSWLTGKQQANNYKNAMNDYNSQMQGYLGGYQGASQQAMDAYNRNAQQYLNTPEGVNRWLNPNMDYQMDQIGRMTDAQYAAGGKLLSGSKMKALQDRGQQQAKLSWQDAFNNMNASNQQGMGHVGNVANMQLGHAGNMFNAQQGMASNILSGRMGMPATGAGAILSGMAGGLNAGSGVVNAMSNAKKSGLF